MIYIIVWLIIRITLGEEGGMDERTRVWGGGGGGEAGDNYILFSLHLGKAKKRLYSKHYMNSVLVNIKIV